MSDLFGGSNNGSDPDASGKADALRGVTVGTFVASLGTGLALFGLQAILFFILKFYLPRIYRPRTYLVPEKERIAPPPPGLWQWVKPIFHTPNSELIHKCGLDAFFFLRFLRLLLKMFVPMALLILPILLPLNAVNGRGVEDANRFHKDAWNVTGLDKLGWGNVRPDNYNRYWAHLVLAVFVVAYLCFLFYDELRDYVRLRQAYLTSPQHRLRASATTVLVTAIPSKWMTIEALDGLFDVFPGGLRNIWLNRNFDALNDKVDLRNNLAQRLENAEVLLVRKSKQVQLEQTKKSDKKSSKKMNKDQKQAMTAQLDGAAADVADSEGMSVGDPHQMATVRDFMGYQTPQTAKQESGLGIEPPLPHDHDAKSGQQEAPDQGQDTLIGRRHQSTQSPPLPPQTPYSTFSEQLANQADGNTEGRPSTTNPGDFDNLDAVTKSHWMFWQKHPAYPSPVPHGKDEDEFPLNKASPDAQAKGNQAAVVNGDESADRESQDDKQVEGKSNYGRAYDADAAELDDNNAIWRKYLKDSDRDHMRLPAFGWTWMPYMPVWTGIGKKVDTIYYCRKEVARLNLEIEKDQKHPEEFPLMNSAFIQFNHQVAAHMACQSVSHHVPKQMAPRMLEISPGDVVWENMSLKWWERYVRTALIIVAIIGLNILWGIPVAFTGILSQLSSASARFSWLQWFNDIPVSAQSVIQGVVPPLLLTLLVLLAPLILRLFHWLQGLHTGVNIQLAVQVSYFAFLFVQVFLVITVSSGLTRTIQQLISNPTDTPSILAQNLPGVANYFFSYMILQALSLSASALLQPLQLFLWFIVRPLADGTPRDKFKRQLNLNFLLWGKFFPVYTNLAVIGIIYSIISPLILVFNVVTFSLFWIVYRHNILYVNKFRHDTGGLLFPKAINQLFTGLYFMELCLIGLFFLVRGSDGDEVVCKAQAIIMIVVLVLTIIYQVLLNEAFGPLLKFLPITLEDDAVRRDEEYARVQAAEWDINVKPPRSDGLKNTTDEEEHELQDLRDAHALSPPTASWAKEPRRRRSENFGKDSDVPIKATKASRTEKRPVILPGVDVESQQRKTEAISEYIFGGLNDEVEDLTAEERNVLIDRAFRHKALRARRPAIWVPQDDLGVCEDEIQRTGKFSNYIWISNKGAAVNSQGNSIFRKNPPDFSELDLIAL